MDGQPTGACGVEPIQHRATTVFCQFKRRNVSKTKLLESGGLPLGRIIHADVQHVLRLDWTCNGPNEVSIPMPQQISKHHRMGKLELPWRHDIRVSIHPEHSKIAVITFIQISEGGQVHQAISAEDYQAIRLMLVDKLAGMAQLSQQGIARHHAIFYWQRLIRWMRYWHFFYRASGLRREPFKKFGSKVVRRIVASLPLRKDKAQRFVR